MNYDYNYTTLSDSQVKTKVLSSIVEFNNTYLNNFNSEFRYSNFTTTIDGSDGSIVSNETEVVPYFLITPELSTNTSISLTFNAPILVTSPKDATHPIRDQKGLFSSAFVSEGLTCQIEDDGDGGIRIVKVSGSNHIELKKIGTIDYNTGTVSISNLVVDSYTGRGIKLYGKLTTQNYTSSLKYILAINPEDIVVSMNPVRR